MQKIFWKWSLIGMGTALFLVWAQANAVDGVAGMLQVGERTAIRPLIEEQLGAIPLADGRGHDGQIFYAIGLDLDGGVVAPLLDHPAYRYRRILFPLLASGFGLLDGWALLYTLIGLNVLAMAICTGLVAVMAWTSGKSDLFALAVVLNPGIWLSIQLVTSDVLSTALMVVGLYSFGRRNTRPAGWFSLSGLAKDVNLMTPVPLGAKFRDWVVMLVPAAVLIAWMTHLQFRFGDGFATRGNLDWPFLGMFKASANWTLLDRTEWVYLAVAMLTVSLGVVFSFRRTWLQWPIVAWTFLAIISSNWVWDFGNNAVRAFAPILLLVALSATSEIRAPSKQSQPSTPTPPIP